MGASTPWNPQRLSSFTFTFTSVHHQEFFTVHTAMVCQQTCMTYTIVVCTVKSSWRWTEELPETCRVLFQK